MSDAENIIFGVPVLGPLRFLIYINDIVHSSTQGEFVIFADDTNIFIAAKTKKEVYNVSNHVLRYIQWRNDRPCYPYYAGGAAP